MIAMFKEEYLTKKLTVMILGHSDLILKTCLSHVGLL